MTWLGTSASGVGIRVIVIGIATLRRRPRIRADPSSSPPAIGPTEAEVGAGIPLACVAPFGMRLSPTPKVPPPASAAPEGSRLHFSHRSACGLRRLGCESGRVGEWELATTSAVWLRPRSHVLQVIVCLRDWGEERKRRVARKRGRLVVFFAARGKTGCRVVAPAARVPELICPRSGPLGFRGLASHCRRQPEGVAFLVTKIEPGS